MAHLAELASRNADAGPRDPVPRSRHLRPLRPGGLRRGDAARRAPDRLHAVPARDEPGDAPGDLRVPDRDLRADRAWTSRTRPGYDGSTVAADACYVARGATRRSEGRRRRDAEPAGAARRPHVRARVRDGGRRGAARRWDDRPGRGPGGRRGRRVRDLPAAQLLRLPRAGARHRRRRVRGRCAPGRPRRSAVARRARGAGELRLRARDRRGPVGREPHELRRAALRVHGRPGRAHPPAAGPDRRRDARPRGQARVRAHAPDPRAAHPAREGHVEHHDQPDAARARRAWHTCAGSGPRGSGTSVGRASRSPRRRSGPSACRTAFDRPTFKEFALDLGRPAEDVVARGPRPGRPPRLPARVATTRAWRTCSSWPSPRSARGPTSPGSRRCSPREAGLRALAARPPRRARGRRRASRPRRCPPSCGGPRRRGCPRSPSPTSSATSPSSRPARSGSTPASIRSARAR